MFRLKAILVIPVTLFALCACETQPARILPPKFTVVPVEQDAPWAGEWLWGAKTPSALSGGPLVHMMQPAENRL
jgi:hypothetical protein